MKSGILKKKQLIGLTREELESFAAGLGEPAYRGRQLFEWLYRRRMQDFQGMTNLPEDLRSRLAQSASIGTLGTAARNGVSSDGSEKFLFELEDGLRIESVHLPDSPGETVCISSQVGCALKCSFCATGRMGFFRNLTAGEMLLQVMEVERLTERRLTNVVFMGMGEPFHNYNQVVRVVRLLADKEGLAVTPAKITVSTVGIVPMIERWTADLPPAKLALSLHAATDKQRSTIMPVNRVYPIEVVFKSLRRLAHASQYPLTVEYIMIDGFNDRYEDAENLSRLLRNLRVKVNLIRLHPTQSELVSSSDTAINRFMKWLTEFGVTCTLRQSRGVENKAACGMLFSDEPCRPVKTHGQEQNSQTTG